MKTLAYIFAGGAAVWALVHLLTRYTFWRPWKPAHWPRILMYHRVANEPASGMNCPPENFELHLNWLKQLGYRFATVSELATQNSGKIVALTFDDGYRDNFELMFPILERFDAKATIYLAPSISGVEKLSAEQICKMVTSGRVEFGAHTMNHVNLTKLDSAAAVKEISESKNEVEKLTGVPCRTFSFPFGRYAAEHVKQVVAAGFASAVTVKKTIMPFDRQPHELPRISIHGAMNRLQFRIALGTGKFRV